MNLDDILTVAVKKGASDVHLKAGIIPVIRKHGTLRPLTTQIEPLTGEQIHKMAEEIMTPLQKEQLAQEKEVDVGYGVSGLGRFRINVFKQRGTTRMVIRSIPHKVPRLANLSLPPIVHRLTTYDRGLILVTGATGSGKSTTQAAIIQEINHSKSRHILTIEDPIEFLIRDHKSIITQREIGIDTVTFADALRSGLRQDPDVIFIGEMRDKDTIETALTAAETGHLVLSTLHTLDAQESINRILTVFPPHQQDQIRRQLASVLKAIVSQRLAKRKDKAGFAPVTEVLINTARVKEMIRDSRKTKDLLLAIEEGDAHGMHSFDQSLMGHLVNDTITFEEAMQFSTNPEEFAIRYSGITRVEGKKWSQEGHYAHKVDSEWANLGEVEIDVPQTESNPPQGKKRRA